MYSKAVVNTDASSSKSCDDLTDFTLPTIVSRGSNPGSSPEPGGGGHGTLRGWRGPAWDHVACVVTTIPNYESSGGRHNPEAVSSAISAKRSGLKPPFSMLISVLPKQERDNPCTMHGMTEAPHHANQTACLMPSLARRLP